MATECSPVKASGRGVSEFRRGIGDLGRSGSRVGLRNPIEVLLCWIRREGKGLTLPHPRPFLRFLFEIEVVASNPNSSRWMSVT
ncbi:hypothetical protein CEXT_262241 [Caerostris extrusa]|uniref:Uncharacterized protein n=1 Tax=Caerostris extrusa TaxID=172846 RepID=A0AAV4NK06_CAEEX|nr:hypothetical protein CEXT_262241 [Caerostris extrusa]